VESARRVLWAKAYEIWEAWDFGKQVLATPCCSELDYALTGFALENLTSDKRSELIQTYLSQITNLETKWHSSIIDMRNVRNRLILQMQPLLVAQQLAQGQRTEWRWNNLRWPQGYTESEYDKSKYD
jgi:hypothetical protein